jgi:hypothetical protein
MKLEVHERLALPNLLPTEGEYAALKTLRQAREMFSFTPEEVKFYELRTDKQADGTSKVVWNVDRAREQVKDCPVTEYIMDVIRTRLVQMNNDKKLTEGYFSLFEKFVMMYK